VFAEGEAVPSSAYRIILTVAENPRHLGTSRRVHGPAERWAQTPVGAA